MNKPTFVFTLFFLLKVQVTIGQISSSWAFRNELIGYMQSPKDTVYIEDRKKLEKIGGLKCTAATAIFKSKTKTGDSIYISIRNKKFIASNHSLYLADTIFKFIHNEKRIDHLIAKDLIDGKRAFGIDANYPNVELSEIKIKWNHTWLKIPDSAFHNLYETHLCLDYLPVEAYLNRAKTLLYIYISASDGVGSYSVKLVFDRHKYLTRIVNRNEMTDGYDFLDATTTEVE